MQPTEPGEYSMLEAGDHSENARLLSMFKLGLKADHVPKRTQGVVLPELNDSVGRSARARVRKANRFHRTIPQGFGSTLRHDFDWQAALEIGRRALPVLELRLLRRK